MKVRTKFLIFFGVLLMGGQKLRSCMNLPKGLWCIVVFLVIAAIVVLVVAFATGQDLLNTVSSSAIVITLAALLAYAYYTYQLAREAYRPCASFTLTQDSRDEPPRITFRIYNHCKLPLECWCKLIATVHNKTLPLSGEGFYGGHFPWHVKPLLEYHAPFPLKERVLERTSFSIDQLRQFEEDTGCVQLHLKFRFAYDHVREKPRKPEVWGKPVYYYFNAKKNRLVLDVGAYERRKCGLDT